MHNLKHHMESTQTFNPLLALGTLIYTFVDDFLPLSNMVVRWKSQLPFRYPCGVRDCLVCTNTVRVTTFPTKIANVRLTMNNTVKKRLINPQQHRVQRCSSDWAEPVRLSVESVVGSRTAAFQQTLTLGGNAVMALDCVTPQVV